MAVYTTVTDEALAAYLADYELGEAVAFKGIAEGVENSNFYLETTTGRYILTLFEKRAKASDIPYFIALKRHLADKKFPCPLPIDGKDGIALRSLAGRPSVIVTFLPGLSPRNPSPDQCYEIGRNLARMHLLSSDFKPKRDNDLGPKSWHNLWTACAKHTDRLRSGTAASIDQDLSRLDQLDDQLKALPQGTIHADLFPDNTFFLDQKFTGAIDFYFACTGALAYDLAICLNAWTFEINGAFNKSKASQLFNGYETIRRLTQIERNAFPELCLGAAMRFFLTRLVDLTETPNDALVKPKDPLDFARRLDFHRTVSTIRDYYS